MRLGSASSAIQQINRSAIYQFEGWEKVDNWGMPLIEPILARIEAYPLLIADITRLNFNVTFEVGFAIGAGKRVLLVMNSGLETEERTFKEIGIYDTLGYRKYENSHQLAELFRNRIELRPIHFSNLRDTNAPIFVLEKPARTDDVGRIISRVKKSRIRYRSFAPAEEPRLAAVYGIEQTAKSVSLIIPLCAQYERDAEKHNLRAAFLAGLGLGMRRHVLLLHSVDSAVPLDIRDIVTRYRDPTDIDDAVSEAAFRTYEYLNNRSIEPAGEGTLLGSLSIGDPMAENEFVTLGNYYLRTDEFLRARRGEVNLVVGRKGTGKTALWSQLRDDIRRDPANIVADLKPEGYQLVELREEVLNHLAEGAKSHLITAFWEYLLYMELAYKMLEKDSDKHLRDNTLYHKYVTLEGFFKFDKAFLGEGDFSERLRALTEGLISRYKSGFGTASVERISVEQVTELLYSSHLRNLREAVIDYIKEKEEIWILFDNLDKGWSSHGLANEDVFILRCLIDAGRKIRNDVRRSISQFHVIVFVRNDIYQMLMDESPDFGKELRASLDWSDDELLKTVLARRLKVARADGASFDQIWSEICTPYYQGRKSLDFMVEHSLMRPRNLLKLFNYCRGAAVNRELNRIGEEEITKGFSSYSDDVLVDVSNEVRDLCPEAKDILYAFIGEKAKYKRTELIKILTGQGISKDTAEQVIEYMIYYGIIGIVEAGPETKYIFDVGYDIKKLRAIAAKSTSVRYVLHSVLHPALGIRW